MLIRVQTPKKRQQATTLLADAFAQDPAWGYFLAALPVEHRASCYPQLMATLIEHHHHSRQAIWGWQPDANAAAAAFALVEDRMGQWHSLLGLLRTWRRWRVVPKPVFKRMNQYANLSRKAMPKGVSHILTLVGVAQNQQGQGQGSALIRALASHYGPQAHWALDTENPANIELYQHLGFQLYDQHALGDIDIYRLHKPPTKAAKA